MISDFFFLGPNGEGDGRRDGILRLWSSSMGMGEGVYRSVGDWRCLELARPWGLIFIQVAACSTLCGEWEVLSAHLAARPYILTHGGYYCTRILNQNDTEAFEKWACPTQTHVSPSKFFGNEKASKPKCPAENSAATFKPFHNHAVTTCSYENHTRR